MRLLSLIFCSIVLLVGTDIAAAVDYSGDYDIRTPQGSMSLALTQDAGGKVSGSITMVGGTCSISGVLVVDEDGDTSIEGTMACAGGGGEFEFYGDDEDEGFYLLVTPNDDSGKPRSDLATLYFAQPGVQDNAADMPPHTTPPAGGGTRDPRLIGVWSTQVIMNTPGGSMATQMLMAVRDDGLLVDLGSRALGGTSDINIDTGLSGGGESVSWRTNGNALEVSSAGSPWVHLARFEVSGDRLLLVYYDGDRKLWYRQ